MSQIKPSDINILPWNSVHQKMENEQSMWWMITKLIEHGNEFRDVDYTEYKEKWQGSKSEDEYNKYRKYLKSADTIILYSPTYQEVADKLNQLTQ